MISLAFIVIWGNKWLFKPVQGGWCGEIHCPDCGVPRNFVEKQPVKYFTLYWMPLFATSKGDPFIECVKCEGKFDKPANIETLVPGSGPSRRIV